MKKPIKKPRKGVCHIIQLIFAGCCRQKPKARLAFSIGLPQRIRTKAKRMPLKLTITNEQKVLVTLTPVTDSGKPAKVDGAPTWEVISGDSTIELVQAGGGMSANLISSDNPGDTQILVKADADIGDGVEEISDIITLTVAGASAKNLGIKAATPVPK